MNIDLDPLDEREDEELEETPVPISAENGRPITIRAEGLTKYFTHQGEIIKAVDGVSFTFTEQQFVTIMGPSGSGKSTLLYVLGGMDRATSGELMVDGVDVVRLSEWQEPQFRRLKLGFVFQSFHLLPNLTALENVMLPMQLAGGPYREQMRDRARSLLVEVGISEDMHHRKPSKLSGGQQQRVAIARALANDPKVILADEPTGDLDSRASKRIIELLKKLAVQGKTVIVVTHDRSIARVADVRLEMRDGKISPMPRYIGAAESAKRMTVPKKPLEEREVTVVAEGLSKYFADRGRVLKAVDEATFSFTEQQFITITGPSGAGKSTLLYVLSGMDKATKGEVLVDGVDVRRLKGRKQTRFRREKVGFVFQSFHLLPYLTALENVMLPMQLLGGKSQAEMRDRARSLLFQVGINENRINYKPERLSGGQQQRVAIARALANDPKVILADEPTGDLDSLSSKRIIELLKTLAEEHNKTVIVVTHDRGIARDADVRLELLDGRVKSTTGSYVVSSRPATLAHKKKSKKK
ncbi:MAG TPA: ATP-binding cassette domain-containing protein [Ktedonobacteraceae bacterium]|nr:ATP-binding cassette domain-containing protein [Ktedonobacteraceae bacterium]